MGSGEAQCLSLGLSEAHAWYGLPPVKDLALRWAITEDPGFGGKAAWG